MFLIRNLSVFACWAGIMWLFFHDVVILLCVAVIFLCAAPFFKWIVTESPGGNTPPLTCMSRYAAISSTTALSIAKASIYGGKAKPKSFDKVITREGG